MNALRSISYRFYQEYLMPNRLSELESLLIRMKSLNFVFHSYLSYYNSIGEQSVEQQTHTDSNLCILRIDVDSDPNICHQIHDLLVTLEIRASFYFRLNTINQNIMQRLHTSGFDVGYHFEEIATYAKQNKITSKEAILKELPSIQKLFTHNFQNFETSLGQKCHTVASHGDFANRRLKLTNSILITPQI